MTRFISGFEADHFAHAIYVGGQKRRVHHHNNFSLDFSQGSSNPFICNTCNSEFNNRGSHHKIIWNSLIPKTPSRSQTWLVPKGYQQLMLKLAPVQSQLSLQHSWYVKKKIKQKSSWWKIKYGHGWMTSCSDQVWSSHQTLDFESFGTEERTCDSVQLVGNVS